MTTHKGFGLIAALIVVAGLLVLGGGAYVVMNPEASQTPMAEDDGVQTAPGDHPEEEHDGSEGMVADNFPDLSSITWKLETKAEVNGVPQTLVKVVVAGSERTVGTFEGSCAEVGASGGVDGQGLLAGELSAVQCWYAGGGEEIGVFAHEDGGYQIMVGELGEPTAESGGFRGNFIIKTDVSSY